MSCSWTVYKIRKPDKYMIQLCKEIFERNPATYYMYFIVLTETSNIPFVNFITIGSVSQNRFRRQFCETCDQALVVLMLLKYHDQYHVKM